MQSSFKGRQLFLVLKAGIALCLDSPRDFFSKVSQRMEEIGRPFLAGIAERMRNFSVQLSSPGTELLERGNLRAGITMMESEGKWWNFIGRLELAQAKRKLDFLRTPFTSKVPASLGTEPELVSIVAIVSNSLPFTQSGYTLRSQATFQALAARGWRINGFTRPGYPALIGRLAVSCFDEIDGVKYHRVIPTRWPSHESVRVSNAIEDIT